MARNLLQRCRHRAWQGKSSAAAYAYLLIRTRHRFALTAALLGNLLWAVSLPAAGLAELDLQVIDADTRQPLAVRLRITNSLGRSPRIRGVPRLGSDFTFRGTLNFKLKSGRYHFTIDHGPHYTQRSGHLEADKDGFDQKILVLPRIANLRQEGWYGGDVWLARKREDIELLMDAEELDLAAVPTWVPQVPFTEFQAKQHRGSEVYGASLVDYSAGLADFEGGRLLAAHLDGSVDPLRFPDHPLGFAQATRGVGTAHLTVLDPYAWDLPMLIAHGLVDSIAVLNDHQQRDEDILEFRGRPSRDARFQAPHGLARYGEHIFFQLLNCGLRVAPAAASGSGACDNPPGFNRVYVACGDDFSETGWWQQLALGRSIVSNGPLLRARVNQELPGHVFRGSAGSTVELEITCSLATRQKIDYLEIIKDGLVVDSVRLDELAAKQGKLPIVTFDTSGWCLVRAVSSMGKTYRGAMTAPWFVEFDEQPRVSKQAAEFFLAWVFERARGIRRMKLEPEVMRARIAEQRVARDFFQQRVESANAP